MYFQCSFTRAPRGGHKYWTPFIAGFLLGLRGLSGLSGHSGLLGVLLSVVLSVGLCGARLQSSQSGATPGIKVSRWQNLIPSFPWIVPGWRAWGRNPRKGRDQILQHSHSPEARRAKHIRSKNLAMAIWQPCTLATREKPGLFYLASSRWLQRVIVHTRYFRWPRN